MDIKYFDDMTILSKSAAELIQSVALKTLEKAEEFLLVLSGGKTPMALYNVLTEEPYRKSIPWNQIHFFFGDERIVPTENPLSNYFTADEYLFKKLSIPKKRVHRIRNELGNAKAAALDYKEHLKNFFDLPPGQFPAFDMVLLGVGTDGHTASLFPGDKALKEKDWILEVETAHTPPLVPRVSMSLPLLNSARNVLFLADVEGKGEVLEKILNQEKGDHESPYPSAMIHPKENLVWYLSKKAE